MKSLMWFAACWVIVIAGYTSVFSQTVSDEARKHFNRGMAAVESAKSQEDWESAIDEFNIAKGLAPDWPDVYFNLGTIQEKTGKYDEAIVNLKQYLKLVPNADDAAAVRDLIDKAEYKAERMRKEAERNNRVVGTWASPTGQDLAQFTFYLKDGQVTIRHDSSLEELLQPVTFDGENLSAKWVQRSSFHVEYTLDLKLGPDGRLRGTLRNRLLRVPATWRGRPVGVFAEVRVELRKTAR